MRDHPGGKLRVLSVDDSVVVRKILTEILSSDDLLQVVATAPNGQVALDKLERVEVDIVTLDVEMPVMDGLETLRHIRRRWPDLPVIMFSSVTRDGASATLDALAEGANDYVAKPSRVENLDEAMVLVTRQLIPKIKTLCRDPSESQILESVGQSKTYRLRPDAPPLARTPIELVAIATSTGGPQALTDVLRVIPRGFRVPICIVQHMPPVFTTMLGERLDSLAAIDVREARSGEFLEPGTAYIAPGDFHLVIQRLQERPIARLKQTPPVNSCRPSADPLLRSAAEVFGAAVLAVVMTGMGEDAFDGATAIAEAGGQVVVQDRSTSAVWGMPRLVARSGIANRILPLAEIGPEIVRRVTGSVR